MCDYTRTRTRTAQNTIGRHTSTSTIRCGILFKLRLMLSTCVCVCVCKHQLQKSAYSCSSHFHYGNEIDWKILSRILHYYYQGATAFASTPIRESYNSCTCMRSYMVSLERQRPSGAFSRFASALFAIECSFIISMGEYD